MALNTKKTTYVPERPYLVALILAFIAGYILLQNYIFIILVAFVTASLTNPIYKFFLRKTNNQRGRSVLFTSFASFFLLLIPFAAIVFLTIWQTSQLIESINVGEIFSGASDLPDIVDNAIAAVNEWIYDLTGVVNALSSEAVYNALRDAVLAVANGLLDIVESFFKGIPSFFTGVIIFLFVYAGLLTHQDELMRYLYRIMPFDRKVVKVYADKTNMMIKAMTRGQVIIAICQGAVGALSMYFLGLGDYVFFFFVIFSFLSLIPLGSGIVIIPVGIIAMLFGNFWGGLAVLLTHFLVTTNIDNLLKPKLVPKGAKLQSALVIMAALGGVALFGLLGVVLGPVIMVMITTTIELYAQQRDELSTKLTPAPEQAAVQKK